MCLRHCLNREARVPGTVLFGGMFLGEAAAVLGVSLDANREAVNKAFRKLALRYHPDKCKVRLPLGQIGRVSCGV